MKILILLFARLFMDVTQSKRKDELQKIFELMVRRYRCTTDFGKINLTSLCLLYEMTSIKYVKRIPCSFIRLNNLISGSRD